MTKRFICGLGFPINSDDPIRIISDSVEGNDYCKFSDICNVLNEQQFTIEQLQDLCGKSDGENSHLRIENKRLQEENEHLKSERRNDAKEFSALFKQNFGLKRENEQLRQELKEIKENPINYF